MTLKEHNKHAELAKPGYGNFGRNEWAFVGTKCDVIKSLADKIFENLSADHKCAYIDTSHDEHTLPHGRLAAGATAEYIDHIQYHQFNYRPPFDKFHYNRQFSGCDLVLVNGNHHQANAQVVVIDIDKIESLRKRVLQLTNVEMILVADNAIDVFDFIKHKLPNWQQLPVFSINETGKIIAFFRKKLEAKIPVLNGLVLAGGKSVRMGYDKTVIKWHGKEQRYHISDILKEFSSDVFISCREEQAFEIDKNYDTLADTFIGLGPFGAILSAFRKQPANAWFVVASDLPLLDSSTLAHLIANRDAKATATTYESPFDNLPESLVTIWEPKSYPLMLSFLAQGYSCPRKVLINSDSKIIKPLNPDAIMNINTPTEADKVKELITEHR